MSAVFCPATMCPLFAAEGSPWTGDKNSPCEQSTDGRKPDGSWDGTGCLWYSGDPGKGNCMGCAAAHEQIGDVLKEGGTLQVGPLRPKRAEIVNGRSYECARAHECQWQRESGDDLCPPRRALALGVDPRNCAY